jgi:hypothetical protein
VWAGDLPPSKAPADVESAWGKTVPEVFLKLGATEQTYERWKREYGGLRTNQAKRLNELEKENAGLKRLLATGGLKVPAKQTMRRRLWLGEGACIRLRSTHRNHVCSYDFVVDRTVDRPSSRLFTIVDEYTRECLAIDVSTHCWGPRC